MNVFISDCDHESVDIERDVLRAITNDVQWLSCSTEEEVIEHCKEADGVIVQYAPFTRKVFENLPNLKVIARYGVGVDTIDLQAASEHGVQVCNVPDYGVNEVSDHAFALIMALARKIVLMNESVKRNEWDYQKSIPIHRLEEQTLGVIGLGRIGNALAEKAHGLGMDVIGFDNSRGRKYFPSFVKSVSFEELLRKSDIISIHIPLNEATRDLISTREFQLMKDGAYIVNTSRGGIIDEEALIEALEQKQIAGAALDVFEKEPPLNKKLFQFDNFIGTPHMAWYSIEASQELKRKAAEEVVRVLTNKQPEYPVNELLVDKA